MSVPLSNTFITVVRNLAEQNSDPSDTPTNYQTIASSVRAVISPPNGTAKLVGGTQLVYNAQLRCDTTDLLPQDRVTDASTGIVWRVLATSQVNSLGMVFTMANLRMVTGAV